VAFAVSGDAYDRFMGRYSTLLAPVFVGFAGVTEGDRVLDVGCGPGALTSELARRVGAARVAAVDPSASFVTEARRRNPSVEVHEAAAESLPFPDGTFDRTLGQLVVHFMSDPVAGIREMARVTEPGGEVAACVWDYEEGGSPLTSFWEAVRSIDPTAEGERELPGTRRGHLGDLFREAGLGEVVETTLSIEARHETFEQWWEPFQLGVGPAGVYVARLDERRRDELEAACRALLDHAPFTIEARAWAARATVEPR
jgi:SAM-dependent methyltransferase